MTPEQQTKPKWRHTAELLALYKRRLKNAGFRRITTWISPELDAFLLKEGRRGECMGRTLERLLLGEAATRPTFPHGSKEEGPAPGKGQ